MILATWNVTTFLLGEYAFEDCMEDDGVTQAPTFVRVTLIVKDDEILADYTRQRHFPELAGAPYLVVSLVGDIGGLAAMQRINEQKAGQLYQILDECGDFFVPRAHPGSRSLMNVVFQLRRRELEPASS